MDINANVLLGYLGMIGNGALTTLELTFFACLFGFPLALVMGMARLSNIRILRWAATAFVELFRTTSIYVQLFWFYFVLPFTGVNITAMQAGIMALTFLAGAYGSELVRCTILTVPKDQREASLALNLSRWHTFWHIVLPQAIVVMIPLFNNLSIEIMKSTAIVSLITISDLTFQVQLIRTQTGETAAPFLASLMIYFAIATVMDLAFRKLEARIDYRRTTAGSR